MVSSSDGLSGKTALITGCNRGIGLETVKLLASKGVNMICCTRVPKADFVTFTDSLTSEHGINIEHLHFDLNDEDSIKEALKPLIRQKRQIDILINNAGVAAGGMLQMTSMAQLKEVFQVNFFAQVLLTQLVSKLMMRQRSGVIVNMGSVAGIDNFAGYTAYGSSKAAMMFFTKTIARELAPYGIRVNAVAPGLTDTYMASQMEGKAWQEMVGRSDLGRLGRPEEIARAIVWLASDESSFVTGQTLRVDGGM